MICETAEKTADRSEAVPDRVIRTDRLAFSRGQFSEMLLFIALFFCFSEIFYARFGISTGHTVLLTCLVTGFSCFALRERVKKEDILCFVTAVFVMCYSVSTEGIRYFLTILIVVFARKPAMKHLPEAVKFFVLYSFPFALAQIIAREERAHGFYLSSPTMYSCFLLIAEAYLLICIYNARLPLWNLVFPVLCLAVSYLTGVRTVLLAGGVLLLFYGFLLFLKINHIVQKKKLLFLAIPAGVLLLLLFFRPLWAVLERIVNRTNISKSNATRLSLYRKVLAYWLKSPGSLFFGNRGGSVEALLTDGKTYIPAHLDYLLVLCEYGIVGFFAIFGVLLKNRKKLLYFFCLFTVCAFHNGILSPSLMLLLSVTMADVERRDYRLY